MLSKGKGKRNMLQSVIREIHLVYVWKEVDDNEVSRGFLPCPQSNEIPLCDFKPELFCFFKLISTSTMRRIFKQGAKLDVKKTSSTLQQKPRDPWLSHAHCLEVKNTSSSQLYCGDMLLVYLVVNMTAYFQQN